MRPRRVHEQEQHGQEQQAPWASTWSGQIAVSAARGGGRGAQHRSFASAPKPLSEDDAYPCIYSSTCTHNQLHVTIS